MVGSHHRRVHAANTAFHIPLRLFPSAMSDRKSQSWEMSCAQIAIIPKNSVSDARAAASSTKIFNIIASLTLEHTENNVPFLFFGQASPRTENRRLVNPGVVVAIAAKHASNDRRESHGSGQFPVDAQFWQMISFRFKRASSARSAASC